MVSSGNILFTKQIISSVNINDRIGFSASLRNTDIRRNSQTRSNKSGILILGKKSIYLSTTEMRVLLLSLKLFNMMVTTKGEVLKSILIPNPHTKIKSTFWS